MNFSLSSFTQRIARRTSHHPAYVLYPYRDWAVLLACFALCLLGFVLWSTLLFSSILNGEAFTHAPISAPGTDTVDTEELDAVLEYFKQKQTQTTSLKQIAPTFSDPSL